METSTTCINCGHPIADHKYCPNCGQKVKPTPITWRGLILEISSKWLGTDNRFYRTVVGLTVYPHKVVHEYLEGNRVRYISPISYLILMGFIYLLSFQILGLTPKEVFSQSSQEINASQYEDYSDQQKLFMENYLSILTKNVRLLFGIMIPTLALSLNWFYKRRNYLENFLLAAYVVSHSIWLNILSNIIYSITGEILMMPMTIISLIYSLWAIGNINPMKTKIWTYAKPIFVVAVGYLGFMFLLLAISMIILIQTLNPSGSLN